MYWLFFQNGVLNSVLLGVNEYLLKYQQGPEAAIINVSSMSIFRNHYEIPIYIGTKYAVLGFTKCWGSDEIYRKTKIRIMAVCPGITTTPMMKDVESNRLPSYLYDTIDSSNYPKQE